MENLPKPLLNYTLKTALPRDIYKEYRLLFFPLHITSWLTSLFLLLFNHPEAACCMQSSLSSKTACYLHERISKPFHEAISLPQELLLFSAGSSHGLLSDFSRRSVEGWGSFPLWLRKCDACERWHIASPGAGWWNVPLCKGPVQGLWLKVLHSLHPGPLHRDEFSPE